MDKTWAFRLPLISPEDFLFPFVKPGTTIALVALSWKRS